MKSDKPANCKIAVISGVTGQDGSYLAEFLLDKGYRVIGFSRRASVNTLERISNLLSNPAFLYREGDVTDSHFLIELLSEYRPDEFYNLAAQSHVATSFKQPDLTWQVNAQGVLNILSAIRVISPDTRLYQASTSEMFGDQYDTETVDWDRPARNYQDEDTIFNPQSPYAIAKLAAHHAMRLYRDSYGLYCACGILFNHESPRRGEQFVTRKVTKYVAGLKALRDEGVTDLSVVPKLQLGNLDAARDWGYAGDYVEAMWMMLQQDKPDDFVVGTGRTTSVKNLVEYAFRHIGIENWEDFIEINPAFIRPSEVPYLCAKTDKVNTKLGWNPRVSFEELVQMMVDEENS